MGIWGRYGAISGDMGRLWGRCGATCAPPQVSRQLLSLWAAAGRGDAVAVGQAVAALCRRAPTLQAAVAASRRGGAGMETPPVTSRTPLVASGTPPVVSGTPPVAMGTPPVVTMVTVLLWSPWR